MNLQATDSDRSSQPGTVPSIASTLSADHERLERWFQSIVDASGGDHDSLRQPWQAFENELAGHLDAEERHIFPAFSNEHPEEARALLREHMEIRSKLLALGIDLDLHCLRADRVQAFVRDLRAHAQREDRLLHPWAEARLGAEQAQKVRDALQGRGPSAQEEWRIDMARSSLGFSLRHVVLHQINGQFTRWGGALWLDRIDWAQSKVGIWVDLKSVETGDPERDRQVRSPEFFDTTRFPRARFTSRVVRMRGARTALVEGRLSLHGVDGDVDLEVAVVDEKPPSDDRLAFDVTGSVNRQRFGLHWNQDLDRGGIVVGDEVTIAARLILTRAKR